MPRYDRLRDTSAREAAMYIRELEQRIGRLESKREPEGTVTQVVGGETVEVVTVDDTATVTEHDDPTLRFDTDGSTWDHAEFAP